MFVRASELLSDMVVTGALFTFDRDRSPASFENILGKT